VYIVETRQKGSDWQQSKASQPSLMDARNAIQRIGITVRSRKLSGLFEARVIRAKNKRWKRLGEEPEVLLFTEL
jgi:hypothetical protein